ncbi:MAG: hypothetical protein LBI20_02565 [Holosporales bacterium]|jgi:hypothetical protein|nr:hypothetical protein [Holosporales bacterium]
MRIFRTILLLVLTVSVADGRDKHGHRRHYRGHPLDGIEMLTGPYDSRKPLRDYYTAAKELFAATSDFHPGGRVATESVGDRSIYINFLRAVLGDLVRATELTPAQEEIVIRSVYLFERIGEWVVNRPVRQPTREDISLIHNQVTVLDGWIGGAAAGPLRVIRLANQLSPLVSFQSTEGDMQVRVRGLLAALYDPDVQPILLDWNVQRARRATRALAHWMLRKQVTDAPIPPNMTIPVGPEAREHYGPTGVQEILRLFKNTDAEIFHMISLDDLLMTDAEIFHMISLDDLLMAARRLRAIDEPPPLEGQTEEFRRESDEAWAKQTAAQIVQENSGLDPGFIGSRK